MKRISDQQICNIAGSSFVREGKEKGVCNELIPIDETGSVTLMRSKQVAQAQKECCKKEHNEVLREIFEVVNDLLDGMTLGRDNFPNSAWNRYQDLKEKYLEVSNVGQDRDKGQERDS